MDQDAEQRENPSPQTLYAHDVFKEYPDVVSIEQLQTMLNIGRNAAYKLVNTGEIKTIRVGKRYIIPKTSVISFVLFHP